MGNDAQNTCGRTSAPPVGEELQLEDTYGTLAALMDIDEEEESDSQGSWFNTKKLAAIAKAHAAKAHAAAMAMVAKAKALAAKAAAAAKKAKEAKGEVLADCRRGHCGEEEQQLETSWLNAKKLAATLKAHAARVHAAARAMVAKAKALAAKAAAAAKKAKEAKG